MSFLRMFFAWEGRIGRKKFFLNLLLLSLLMIVFFVIGGILSMGALGTSVLSLFMGFSMTGLSLGIGSILIIALLLYGYIIFLSMGYVLLVKRAHDLGISTQITTIYYLVVCIVPVALLVMKIFFPIGDVLTTIISGGISLCGFVAGITLLFVKGTTGENNYGPDPLSSSISSNSVVIKNHRFLKYLGIKFFCLLVVVGGMVYASAYIAKNMIVGQLGNMFTSNTVGDRESSSVDTGAIQKGTLLIEQDPEENILLVQAKETPFFPDYTYSHNSIYYDGEILSGSDSQTFTVFDSVFGNDYAFDKNHLYYKEKIIGDSDLKGPLITHGSYIYHAGSIYHDWVIIPNVDAQTFIIFNSYTSDKNHIYYGNTVVDADVASFVELLDSNEEYDAYDDNHKFYNGDMVLDKQSCLDLRSVVQKDFDVLNDPNSTCSDAENCDTLPVGNTVIDVFYSENNKTCYLGEKYSVESVTYYEISPIQADGSGYKYMSNSVFSTQCTTEDLFLAAIDPEVLTGDELEKSKRESVCGYIAPALEEELRNEIQKRK